MVCSVFCAIRLLTTDDGDVTCTSASCLCASPLPIPVRFPVLQVPTFACCLLLVHPLYARCARPSHSHLFLPVCAAASSLPRAFSVCFICTQQSQRDALLSQQSKRRVSLGKINQAAGSGKPGKATALRPARGKSGATPSGLQRVPQPRRCGTTGGTTAPPARAVRYGVERTGEQCDE